MTAPQQDVGGNSLSLVSLYEISKILSSSFNLEKTFQDVLNLLSSYLQMRRGVVALAGSGGAAPQIAAALGHAREGLKAGRCAYPVEALRRVISTGMPMVVSNAAQDPMFSGYVTTHPDHRQEEDGAEPVVVSIIAVPIKGAEECSGVLSIERDWDGSARFSFETDVRYLTMVANLMAQTIRLHRSVASDRERLLEERARLQKALEKDAEQIEAAKGSFGEIVGDSPAMQWVFEQVRQVAPMKSTVLLRGESGTGKELVARAIHALSSRKDKPFIKVNCAALPETLLESELFGHEKGAFTGATQERKGRFEMANGGTLFLDEIGEISPAFQAKLLRVLQEGELERVGGNRTLKIDVRLVSATNKNLEEAVATGEFRADLYYRINVVPLFLPPLREREGDVPRLALYFLKRFNEENGRSLHLSPKALSIFEQCQFPGNVRELENCVNRVATMTRSDTIDTVDLPCQRDACLSSVLWKLDPGSKPVGGLGLIPASAITPLPPVRAEGPMPPTLPPTPSAPVDDLDDDFGRPGETLTGSGAMPPRARLIAAMEQAGWVQAKAARLLGLTPRQIGYALKKHNVEIKKI